MDKSLILSFEIQKFIKEHENSDLPRLIMQKKFADWPIQAIAEQIKSRRKAKEKLPTWYKTEGVLYPPSVSIEQSSSEKTAKFKFRQYSGDSALDLTGGFGVDSYYLAKKFNTLTYVEENENLAAIAAHNYSAINRDNVTVLSLSAEEFLVQNKDHYDLIYIDPGRRVNNKKARGFEDSKPDILKLLPSLLKISGKIMVKASPMLDISLAITQLKNVEEVVVLAVANEVKELLFILGKKTTSDQFIRCINITSNNEQLLEFNISDKLQEECSPGILDKHLYEPNVTILKSGGYDRLCKRYDLQKLNRNTHLYTAKGLVKNFPGRVFEVRAIVSYNKQKVLPLLEIQKASISVRNFPDTPEQVKKKLGIKDGGDTYLFGYRDLNNRPMIAICKKV